MKKLLKYLSFTIIVCAELILIGCVMAPDLVTPCYIEPEAIEYADYNTPQILPWTTLHQANQILRKMNFIHMVNTIKFARMIEDDDLRYDYINQAQTSHQKQAEELKDYVFGSTGPIAAILGATAITAYFMPRPKEKKLVEKAKEEGKKEANGGK